MGTPETSRFRAQEVARPEGLGRAGTTNESLAWYVVKFHDALESRALLLTIRAGFPCARDDGSVGSCPT